MLFGVGEDACVDAFERERAQRTVSMLCGVEEDACVDPFERWCYVVWRRMHVSRGVEENACVKLVSRRMHASVIERRSSFARTPRTNSASDQSASSVSLMFCSS